MYLCIDNIFIISGLYNFPLTMIEIMRKKYKMLDGFCEKVEKNNEKQFIFSIYHDQKILIKSEGVIIGTYSRQNNIWIWADQSFTADKVMILKTKNIRKSLLELNLNKKERIFVSNNYDVIPTSDLINFLKLLEHKLSKNIVILDKSNDSWQMVLLTKIYINNLL